VMTVVNVPLEVGGKGGSSDTEERWASILKEFKYLIGNNH
jgi:hypothetical protein